MTDFTMFSIAKKKKTKPKTPTTFLDVAEGKLSRQQKALKESYTIPFTLTAPFYS